MPRHPALNSLLAITAVAWLGQSAAAAPGGGLDRPPPVFAGVVGEELRRLSAADRGRLRQLPRLDGPLPEVTIQPGERLNLDSMGSARTVPGHLLAALDSLGDDQLIRLGNSILRVERDSRQVLDRLDLI